MCFHRRPLCRRVKGFTHDDKVQRSDPAIVQVSSFLINAAGGKSQEELCFCRHTSMSRGGAVSRPRAFSVDLQKTIHCMSLLPFYSLKCAFGSHAFPSLVFFTSACWRNIWFVCCRLSQRVLVKVRLIAPITPSDGMLHVKITQIHFDFLPFVAAGRLVWRKASPTAPCSMWSTLKTRLFSFPSGAQQALGFMCLLSPGTSWRHYVDLMAMIGNMLQK